MKWQQGRPRIDGMISRGELERVQPSRERADLLLSQAAQHVASSDIVKHTDAAGACAPRAEVDISLY